MTTNSDRIRIFSAPEVYDTLDLCVSCKACKTECPSSVDMAKLKAEYLYQYYQKDFNHEGNKGTQRKTLKTFVTLRGSKCPCARASSPTLAT